MVGTPVEVRKNPRSTTWYNATILDVKGESVFVGFEEGIWPSREVPAISCRLCPTETSGDSFDPEVDGVVEVSVSASESNPSGWALGKVKTIKNSFYFIGFEGGARGAQELIVERCALRRVSAEQPMDPANLVRKTMTVEADLDSWIRSQDSHGCLAHVQAKGRLLVAAAKNIESTDKGKPQVLLIGFEENVILAEKLLKNIHFQNQKEIQRFHELHERMKARLGEYGTMFKQVFPIEQSLVGRIIGSKGGNIKLLREKFNVEIRVGDSDDYSGDATITVTGNTEESVKDARGEMEFVTVKLPIEASQVGWILGRGYQNIQEIKEKTELIHARFDDTSSSLELCGLRHQVEDARLLINVHTEYLPVYKDMDQEQYTIQSYFDELDTKGERRGGRKGKEKGGDGGKRGGKGSWQEESEKGKGKGKDKEKGQKTGEDEPKKDKGKSNDKGKGKGKDDEPAKGKDKDKGDKGKGKDKDKKKDDSNGKGKGKYDTWKDDSGSKGSAKKWKEENWWDDGWGSAGWSEYY